MNWPSIIAVNIDYGDGDDVDGDGIKETTAHLLQSRPHYGDFGPMAEYVSPDGERFWIVAEYMQECIDNKKLATIPIEVITKQEEIRKKIEYGNDQLYRQNKQAQTGLVLPDDYPVV